MELIADGLLIGAAFTAALYCWVLSRRLNALKSMDKGLGGAIAGLSARVEQTKASLADTKASTGDITRELSALTARAEIAAGRLEILLATLQDRPSARRSETAEDATPPNTTREKPTPMRRRKEGTLTAKADGKRVEPPVTEQSVQTVKADPVVEPATARIIRARTEGARRDDETDIKPSPLPQLQSNEEPASASDKLSALRRIAGARAAQ